MTQKNLDIERCEGSTWTYITHVIKAGLTSGSSSVVQGEGVTTSQAGGSAAVPPSEAGVAGQGGGCVGGRALGVRGPRVARGRGPTRPDRQAGGGVDTPTPSPSARAVGVNPTASARPDAAAWRTVAKNGKVKGKKGGKKNRV